MHRVQTRWACTAALLLGSNAQADKFPNPLTDRFQATLGTFFITSKPTVQLNGESGSGDRVDWDKKFGGVDTDRIRLDCHWRLAERHKIHAIAFDASHERSALLDKGIDWGDATYPVNAHVDAEFSFAILEVGYEYSFMRRENYEIGASFGLHYTRLDASLEAQAEVSGGTLAEDLSDSAGVDAPLPVIGLSGMWSVSHDLWLAASAQFFALSVDEYDGYLQSYRASLTWQPKSWLGIGLGYNLFSIDVDVENEGLDGTLDWTYRGPTIFYSVSF